MSHREKIPLQTGYFDRDKRYKKTGKKSSNFRSYILDFPTLDFLAHKMKDDIKKKRLNNAYVLKLKYIICLQEKIV